MEANGPLRLECPVTEGLSQIRSFEYSSAVLDAISCEKAGFKGMRLLVIGFGSAQRAKKHLKLAVGQRRFKPLKRIYPPGYPPGLEGRAYDFLWMASTSEQEWEKMKRIMANRLQKAAANNEEFLHAAATQLVFNHCALKYSLFERNGQKEEPQTICQRTDENAA
jgi:hypothetical protein